MALTDVIGPPIREFLARCDLVPQRQKRALPVPGGLYIHAACPGHCRVSAAALGAYAAADMGGNMVRARLPGMASERVLLRGDLRLPART
jgi:hypothetical protein